MTNFIIEMFRRKGRQGATNSGNDIDSRDGSRIGNLPSVGEVAINLQQGERENQNKIIFFLDTSSQPRYSKRIKGLLEQGFDAGIYGISRGKYQENACIENHEIKVIAEHKDGEYMWKLWDIIIKIRRIVSTEIRDTDIVYCFGFLMRLSLKMSKSKSRTIYEIGDIFYGYGKFRFLRPLLMAIDRWLVRSSDLTVMTSDGFLKFLFPQHTPTNTLIQQNRVSSTLKTDKVMPPSFKLEGITFGYVGAFRYPNTMFRFAEVIGKKFPKHRFHFYGDSALTPMAEDMANLFENVEYLGSYKNPDDLYKIYSNVDVIVACYDAIDLNERIAEPNKFFEALYFQRPIIVSKGTHIANMVERYQCGFVINASIDSTIESFVNGLSTVEVMNKAENIKNVDTSVFVDDRSKAIANFIREEF